MKVYVASSWREELQPAVVTAIRAYGHAVYDFRNPSEGQKGFAWADIDPDWQNWDSDRFIERLDHPLAEDHFKLDYDAMDWCDACVLVVPRTAGRSSHLELGWCAGAGKLTIVLVTEHEPELMYKLATHVVTSIRAVRDILRAADIALAAADCKAAARKPTATEIALWSLLDDIDTLADIIKPDTLAGLRLHYERTNEIADRRHKLLYSDGYTLSFDPNHSDRPSVLTEGEKPEGDYATREMEKVQ